MASSASDTIAETMPLTLDPIVDHVKDHFERHRSSFAQSTKPPLFVAFQGPQGSGKTYLTSLLRRRLQQPPHNLKVVVVLSIDDLYLPHDELLALASANPVNILLSGRGQPGTHDVALGIELLTCLQSINEDTLKSKSGVRLPRFDKSLFDGQGDRVADVDIILPSVDIVILEGWCVGFYPVGPNSLRRKYDSFVDHLTERDPGLTGNDALLSNSSFTFDDIRHVNEKLEAYMDLWSAFHVFIRISPPDSTPYSLIYKWRLQQEHVMKAGNGGKGMTDAQVKLFIDRYIPGYVFFADGIELGRIDDALEEVPSPEDETPVKTQLSAAPPWAGNGLKVIIDEGRRLVGVTTF